MRHFRVILKHYDCVDFIPDTTSSLTSKGSKTNKAFLALNFRAKRVTSQLRETEMRALQSTLSSLRNVVTRNL